MRGSLAVGEAAAPRTDQRRGLDLTVVRWALAGTTLATVLVIGHVHQTGYNILNLLQPGASGPSAAVIRHDFPSTPLPGGLGYDGQQFYAIARQPMHWRALIPALDRPHYRLSRPLFPWLAWLLHPQGAGPALVSALFVVGLASLFVGAVALGVHAQRSGRSAAWATAYPLIPGALVSLRTTTADALAVACVIMALVAERRGRLLATVGWAVAAVLGKEIVVAVLIGNAITRRTRAAVWAVAVSGVAYAAFWLATALAIGSGSSGVVDLSWPLVGLAGAAGHWIGGRDLFAAGSFLVWALITTGALWKVGIRSRRAWLLLVPLGYVLVLRADPLELNLGGPRTYLPLTAVALFVLLEGGASAASRGDG